MINYQDFILYSKENLERAEDLFQKNDYRYSIFSAHEAIELALKAYLLKYDVISKPKEAGHLPFPVIFQKLYDELKMEVRRQPGRQERDFWLSGLAHIEKIKSALDDMKKFCVRETIWRYTLQIPLTTQQEKILQDLLSKLADSSKEQVNNFGEYVKTSKLESKVLPTSNSPKLVKEIGSILLKYYKKSSNDISSDLSGIGKELYDAMNNNLSTSKKPILSEVVIQSIMKQFILGRTMNWMPMMVFSFSHQQISRYPTDIDKSTANKLYQENKNSLHEFIQKIDSTCKEIFNSIKSIY